MALDKFLQARLGIVSQPFGERLVAAFPDHLRSSRAAWLATGGERKRCRFTGEVSTEFILQIARNPLICGAAVWAVLQSSC
jgi:hypothetical protein